MLQVWGASAAGHPEITVKYDEIRGVSDKAGFIVKNALMFFDLADRARGELGYTTPVFDAAGRRRPPPRNWQACSLRRWP